MTTDPQDIQAPILKRDGTWIWIPMEKVFRETRYRLANGEFLDMTIPYHREVRAAAEILNEKEEAAGPDWRTMRMSDEENLYHNWI